MRVCSASRKRAKSSLNGQAISTAMISARGVMTSSTLSILKAWAWSTRSSDPSLRAVWAEVAAAAAVSPRRQRRKKARRPRLRLAGGGAAVVGSDMVGLGAQLGGVGVWHAEPRENTPLQAFHDPRLGFVLVIVAEQMQHAVNRQVLQMRGERLGLGGGLGGADAKGQGDIAGQAQGARRGREGQHVGHPILLAKARVKRLDRRIVGQQDGDVAGLRAAGVRQ